MNLATTPDRPVITAWSSVSGFGIGRAAFTEGLAAGRTTATSLGQEWSVPAPTACLVPDFDLRTVLGRKGTRSMDRATGLAVTAVGTLLDEEGGDREARTGPGAGLVLGTTTGSAQSIMDFTRDSLQGEQPFFVDPARFPNTVMNCAAGQCAIWYRLKGPNATVAGGRVAGLHALNYASRLLRAGRTRTVLAGAVEEYSHARQWLELRGRAADETEAVLGEACSMFRIEAGGEGLAEVLAIRFGIFCAPEQARDVLESCVRRTLAAAEVTPEQLWAVSPSAPDGALGAAEYGALRAVLADASPEFIVPAHQLGDTAAAAAGIQLAAVLAQAETAGPDRLALITGIDREGAVGCALLRTRADNPL